MRCRLRVARCAPILVPTDVILAFDLAFEQTSKRLLVAEAVSKETSDGQFDVLAKVYRIF